MKVVILAGGLGTRLNEETDIKPKPMVEIGGKPILWHIMKIYSAHGINDFIICCGYRGYVIKEYFANYFLHMSDVTFDMANNKMQVHQQNAEPWRVTLVDTGDTTMTGGRLKRVESYLQDGEVFCFTYGDSVADVDITSQLEFHKNHGKLATVTAVQPPGRFGALDQINKLNILYASFFSSRSSPASEVSIISFNSLLSSDLVLEDENPSLIKTSRICRALRHFEFVASFEAIIHSDITRASKLWYFSSKF